MFAAKALKVLIRATARLFQPGKKEKESPKTIRRQWYGVCEECGKTDGLHKLQGKQYCARCYARIKTEQDFARKKNI